MLAHVLRRARAIDGIDDVVLATSNETRDEPLTWVADDLGLQSFRGSEHDVLGRFATVAALTKADAIVRITGDCPLLAPDIAARVVSAYRAGAGAFVSNDTNVSGFPDGTDTEVVSSRILQEAATRVLMHASWIHGDREHVTSWIRRHYQHHVVTSPDDFGRYKLSVDTPEDLARVRTIFGYLENGDYTLAATLRAIARVEQEGCTV